MKIYFIGGYDKERLLKETNSVKDIGITIQDFMNKCNYKSYYSNVYYEDETIHIDVGCHTQFFEVRDVSQNEYNAYLNF